MNSFKSILAIAIFVVLANFSVVESQELDSSSSVVDSEEFKAYWYDGKAEITSYKLEQARYGELHEGYAVMVFVTEDFS
ncbi:MAG: septum formation inhibitor Maf, partial [Thermodesulfobacteriota bacterium]